MMKKSCLALLTAFLFTTAPAMADTQIRAYEVGDIIEFQEMKPAWYESDYFHIEQDDSMPFEVALETVEETQGEWSMHFTNPKQPQLNKMDLASQVLYVGMRYKFE